MCSRCLLNVWVFIHSLFVCCCSTGGGAYDIVGFQESFMEKDRERICESAKRGGLPYAHFFYNGMGFPYWPVGGDGSGACVRQMPVILVRLIFRMNCVCTSGGKEVRK